MRVLSNMSLIMWDQLTDPYDHIQLADNWAKVDNHDHTPGRGVRLTTGSIEGEAITGALIANEAITEKKLAKVVQERVASNLLVENYSGSATLSSGELAVQGKTGETLTLPSAATPNQTIGIFSKVVETKVTSTSTIRGDFLEATSFKLATNQHVVVRADGTSWLIQSGEPKREPVYSQKGYVKAEQEAGVEPSATRPAFVIVRSEAGAGFVEVQGGAVGGFGATGATTGYSVSFLVPPGVKWKCPPSGATAQVLATTLLL